jgi:hypothetical protein
MEDTEVRHNGDIMKGDKMDGSHGKYGEKYLALVEKIEGNYHLVDLGVDV